MSVNGSIAAEMLRNRLVNDTSPAVVNILNASIASLGILGNTLVIVVLMVNWKYFQSLTQMFILHQSFIDLASSFVFINLRLDSWQPLLAMTGVVGDLACKLWHSEYVLWALFMTSTLNLTLLTTERYFAVVHPVIHLNWFTRTRVKISMLMAWMVSFGYQSYLAMTNELSATGACVLAWKDETTRVFVGIVTFAVEFLVPLTIMLMEYIFIAIKLHRLKRAPANRNIAVAMATISSNSRHVATNENSKLSIPGGQTDVDPSYTASGLLSQPPSNEQELRMPPPPPTQELRRLQHRRAKQSKFSRAFRNVIKTLCLVFVTFVICWTPSEFAYLFYNLGGQLDFNGTLHRLSVMMVMCNMCVNPFIYALQYKEFQINFRRMIRSLWWRGSRDEKQPKFMSPVRQTTVQNRN